MSGDDVVSTWPPQVPFSQQIQFDEIMKNSSRVAIPKWKVSLPAPIRIGDFGFAPSSIALLRKPQQATQLLVGGEARTLEGKRIGVVARIVSPSAPHS